MKKKLITSLIYSTFALSSLSHAMTALDDQELSNIDGQALLSMEYTQGYSAVDNNGQNIDQSNVGFYKLGLEAEMELNANIKKLQLGCGGVNNSISSGCDIDIDHISLSGLPTNSNYTSDDRAATSALLSNPFVELAIKNPKSASTREVMGFRLSAEKISGLMTLGTSNEVDSNGNGVPNGINSFSGYMKTKTASGTAITAERYMTYADTNREIEGEVKGSLLSSSCGGLNICLDIGYKSTDYNLKLESTTAPFTIESTVVSGTRLKDVELKGYGTVGTLNFSGPLKAKVLNLLNLDKQVTGNITGLTTDITVNQNLGLIHALYLNNPASLSLQAQQILWPGASVAANKGWWLAMEDEVDLGSLSPTTKVEITNEVLKQTIDGINKDLTDNPRLCGNLLTGCIGGSALAVGNIAMTTMLDFPLTNLTLQGQNFRSNCFGGLKFC
ncbi:hypothetical protein M5F00_00740 [Acinetobacter sp. ANC 4945]|uniref:Uncharacterized protein n=1 Tax=Acinetobacter amyesii TaxID=2942470 RepID=A0A1T1GS65_9GAMM|nr:hypothetical protein [Acinetobacter amyesii]MCL6246409.1 hypothetical protein [Acinetobacter amyesii]OOV80472.1 hypothetical protein B1202_13130 [Acinetobacter amyesii]